MYLFQIHRSSLIVSVVAALLIAALPGAAFSAAGTDAAVIASGERLVQNMDCNTCHTPKVFTQQGPQLDVSRLLSGHPADEKPFAVPAGLISPAGWGGLFNNSLTAWAGPWGVSFASNLTPDRRTGIGLWTEEIFVSSMRTGTHVGYGRPFLPPMPTYSRLTDAELHAIYSYLKSIKPVNNAVPHPLSPPQLAQIQGE